MRVEDEFMFSLKKRPNASSSGDWLVVYDEDYFNYISQYAVYFGEATVSTLMVR